MQRFKKPEFWAYPVLAIGLWAFFAFAMPNVLEFWEKNQLFRFSSDYWHFFDHEPFGTLIYLQTFLIQFSYYPWLGAIVYALLFTLTAWLFNRCLKTEQTHALWPGLVFSVLLLPTIVPLGLTVVLTALLAFAGACLWLFWKNNILRYLSQAVALAVLTYLLREYIVWVCLLYLSLDLYQNRHTQKKRHWLWLLFPLCVTFLFFVSETMLHKPYEFIFREHLFRFGGQAFSPASGIPYAFFKITPPIWACMGLAAALSLASAMYFKPKLKFLIPIISLLVMGTGIVLCYTQSRSMQNFQRIDRLCRAYRWDEALDEINRQWAKDPQKISNSRNMTLFHGQTKIALLATRKATSLLFTYPQPSFPLLFPLDMVNQVECLSLPSYYTFVGGFGESMHLDYDLITCHAISANVLNRLIRTSLILNDTMPAAKLTHFLEKSLFYRQQAKVYKDDKKRNELPEVKRGKGMLPTHNYTVQGYKPDRNSFRQHFNQPENPYFYEYSLSVCLLNKLHNLMIQEMPNIKKFYHKGGVFTAPRHIQEAVLASFDYNPSRYLYPQRIEGIGQDVWNDYWHFIADNQSYRNGQLTFSELQKKWGHTYWFYDCFISLAYNVSTSQSIN